LLSADLTVGERDNPYMRMKKAATGQLRVRRRGNYVCRFDRMLPERPFDGRIRQDAK
jgi:hypothetical protein